MLGNRDRSLTKTLSTRLALALGRLGVTPNMLTVTGTALSVTAAVALPPKGYPVAGPLVLLAVLMADSLDGILVRATRESSIFGTFLDSTMDRLADGAVLGSLTTWAALSMPVDTLRAMAVAAALVAIVMTATVPYTRARVESIGTTASVGIARRTDQFLAALGSTFLVGLGTPQWMLVVGLVYMTIAFFTTVIQRIRAVHRQIRQGDERT